MELAEPKVEPADKTTCPTLEKALKGHLNETSRPVNRVELSFKTGYLIRALFHWGFVRVQKHAARVRTILKERTLKCAGRGNRQGNQDWKARGSYGKRDCCKIGEGMHPKTS